jgi:hypothetical protein
MSDTVHLKFKRVFWKLDLLPSPGTENGRDPFQLGPLDKR